MVEIIPEIEGVLYTLTAQEDKLLYKKLIIQPKIILTYTYNQSYHDLGVYKHSLMTKKEIYKHGLNYKSMDAKLYMQLIGSEEYKLNVVKITPSRPHKQTISEISDLLLKEMQGEEIYKISQTKLKELYSRLLKAINTYIAG